MSRPLTIAIDGRSSTGKSTLAKQLAEHLGFIYVDTGAMYRVVTLQAMRGGHIDDDLNVSNVEGLIANTHISFYRDSEGKNRTKLNGEDVEQEIREMEVSKRVSYVSAIPEVRRALVDQQRKMAEGSSVVMDGRDIGTVVFPNADLKIFMTASTEVRTQRRFDELKAKGVEITLEEVRQNLEERDKIDSGREDSPLRMADDAVELDNSNLTPEEQFEKVVNWVRSLG